MSRLLPLNAAERCMLAKIAAANREGVPLLVQGEPEGMRSLLVWELATSTPIASGEQVMRKAIDDATNVVNDLSERISVALRGASDAITAGDEVGERQALDEVDRLVALMSKADREVKAVRQQAAWTVTSWRLTPDGVAAAKEAERDAGEAKP